MAELKDILVPDVGGDEVEVIEVCVAVGDVIAEEDAIITVESDKASMDIPAPFAGTIKEIKIALGDKVSEGGLLVVVEAADQAADTPATETVETQPAPEVAVVEEAPAVETAPAPVTSSAPELKEVHVPDIGADGEVDIIDILVAVGDSVEKEDGLITLETDKATMDVPAPFSGVIKELKVENGGKIGTGGLVAVIETVGSTSAAPETLVQAPVAAATAPAASPAPAKKAPPVAQVHPSQAGTKSGGKIHATPSVRRLASEFGVDLTKVTGSGRKGRILAEDIKSFVKYELSRPKATAASSVAGGQGGLQVLAQPKVDFSKFGDVEEKPLTRIQKISGPNLHRNWVTIPHVTQFEEADITSLEAFRKEQNALLAKQKSDLKITPLVFIMKACASALLTYPQFNSSLTPDGENIVLKKYVHIGIAVDTPNGLVVPVVRDVDKKGVNEISRELMEISKKARDGKLKATDMQGGCFTISSLGGIGGTAFTPIVNSPEVGILGVSKSEMKPKWNGTEFEPKLMLPLSLSYDHRVIDGALAARFAVHIGQVLSDIRKLVL